ncbi:MAG: bifunctional hydroxymethylpyrimidine kinase/phosphomethylpyrimidine kinase, partial [Archaeoglobi archaeon]|nr:bifunctional hydroxymethylpyrimidine kinase/phosphomethylpyrimidine kinase [Archaeoglobi archaeon]
MRNVRVAMTIAGSDSIGGAGIQADLKAFAAFGVYGTSAITAITAQNTFEVSKSVILSGDMVYEQIRMVAEDSGIDAAKTGMLGNAEVIEAVARAVDDFGFPLVVDPVMVAKSGARLLSSNAVEALKKVLIPRATLVTPNLDEVRELTGFEVSDVGDMERAAVAIADETGCNAVLVKGGHLGGGKAVDVLYDGERFHRLESPAHQGCFHGTGCSLSAAIAANLALGRDLLEAVKAAKRFISAGIEYAVRA